MKEHVLNQVEKYQDFFDFIKPFSGEPPKGFVVDFLGVLTDFEFRQPSGDDPANAQGHWVSTQAPDLARDGEGWFEALNWFLSAEESSRSNYTMFTLGACYGAQAVGAAKALSLINPKPYKLVAVEPEPTNISWIQRHFENNGISQENYWIVPYVLSDSTSPVLFPVGSPGSGAQNCFATNEQAARRNYLDYFVRSGQSESALENLLLHNNTGLRKLLVDGTTFDSEIRILSAIDLNFLLDAFDFVDFIESDMQQSEILVFPATRKSLKKKVKRIHIGTHGVEVHESLHRMFESDGWTIQFSFLPNSHNQSPLGDFRLNDGILTVINPDIS